MTRNSFHPNIRLEARLRCRQINIPRDSSNAERRTVGQSVPGSFGQVKMILTAARTGVLDDNGDAIANTTNATVTGPGVGECDRLAAVRALVVAHHEIVAERNEVLATAELRAARSVISRVYSINGRFPCIGITFKTVSNQFTRSPCSVGVTIINSPRMPVGVRVVQRLAGDHA